MQRIETFDITIETGERGRTTTPTWVINGFEVEFENVEGGVGPGETFKATANPYSVPHTLLLRGPEKGCWDLERVSITYYPTNQSPYTVTLGGVALDDDADLNIRHEAPQPIYSV